MQNKRKCLKALGLAACIFLGGCASAPTGSEAPELLEPAGVELDYAPATVMDLYTTTAYSSAVVPHVEELFFTVDGTVEDVRVTLGSQVKKGDVLITLDEESLLEQEESMLANLEYTRATYENALKIAALDQQIASLQLEEMRKSGASDVQIAQKQADISMTELQNRQTQEQYALHLSELEAELEQLQKKIGENELVAPCDGTVVAIDDLRAEYGVSAYDVIVQIADESKLRLSGEFITEGNLRSAHEIYALIGPEKYPLRYIPVDMDEYLSTVFAGGTLHTEFEFVDGQPDVASGDYAAVCVVTGFVEDALCIPVNALYSDSAGRYVYKLEEDGSRSRVSVHTGSTNKLYIQITEGLEEGDQVYVKE